MLKQIMFLLLGAAGLLQSVQAQEARSKLPRWEDSTARRIMAQFRDYPSALVPILRQVGKTQTRAKLEEIVDSLAQRAGAITKGPNTALDALVEAGRKAREPNEGTPVPGVLDRLIRIERETDTSYATGGTVKRGIVLRRMLQMPEHTRALNYLLGVVTSESGVIGQQALIILLDEVNPENKTPRSTTPQEIAETRRALRALWDRFSAEPLPSITLTTIIPDTGFPSQIIPNTDARLTLTDYARWAGWGGGRKP